MPLKPCVGSLCPLTLRYDSILTNQLSDSELAKYTDSLKDTGFSLSYNANLDDNGKPEKFITKKDGTVQEKTPLLTFHKASNSIDDFMSA